MIPIFRTLRRYRSTTPRGRAGLAYAAVSGGRLYGPDGRQLGFARVVSDGLTVSYLADVYVLEEARGRGFGLALVRFTVDDGPLAGTKWILHTRDMHRLYARLGFVAPGERTMERMRQ